MTKEERVINYYVLCNKLKTTIRTGWKDWKVNKERLESVAEHIYGTQMLAIAMKSEYEYDIDIYKVIMMLAVHELEEIYIGDLTSFQITKQEKMKIGTEAVKKVLSNLTNKLEIENLILEYEKRETKEAKFAKICDKLQCDIQCKLYCEENSLDINKKENENNLKDERVQEFIQRGEKTIADFFIENDRGETKEEKFDYYCDKLECDLQCRLYDLEKTVDVTNQEGNISFNDERVQSLLKQNKSWSEMWMLYGQSKYNYDDNFKKVSDYAMKYEG